MCAFSALVAAQLDATEDITTNTTPVHHGKELGASDGASWLHALCSPRIVNVHENFENTQICTVHSAIYIHLLYLLSDLSLSPFPRQSSSRFQQATVETKSLAVLALLPLHATEGNKTLQELPQTSKNIQRHPKQQQYTVALSALGLQVAFPVRDELVGA